MPVPVTSRPVSSATMAVVRSCSTTPCRSRRCRSGRGRGARPPRRSRARSRRGQRGWSRCTPGGRSMNALLPGPGYSWSPWLLVPRVELGRSARCATFDRRCSRRPRRQRYAPKRVGWGWSGCRRWDRRSPGVVEAVAAVGERREPSSKVMSISPPSWNACDCSIRGCSTRGTGRPSTGRRCSFRRDRLRVVGVRRPGLVVGAAVGVEVRRTGCCPCRPRRGRRCSCPGRSS